MSPEKTIGIVIARMTSTRLPGKSLRIMHNKPMLGFTLERLKAVEGLNEIWLATTQHPADEKLIQWAVEQGINVFPYPGETDDVVGRVSALLKRTGAERFVAVLGDTPFPDVQLMQTLLAQLDAHPDWDAVWPEDMGHIVHSGVLCFRSRGWEKVDSASQEPKYREHLGSILRDHPDLVVRGSVKVDERYYRPYRLTVDTNADFELHSQIAEALDKPGKVFNMADVVEYLDSHPDLAQHNSQVRQRTVDDHNVRILMAIQMGREFGFTHLARCKTMARALEEHFSTGVTFWVDHSGGREFTAEEIGRETIEGSWSLPEVIRQHAFDKVVIDFRNKLAPSLVQGIRGANPDIPVIVVDNQGLGAMEADALVFPNSHTDPPSGYTGKVYSGRDYTLLGDHFLFHVPEPQDAIIPDDKPYILLSLGSRDPQDLTFHTLEALSDIRDSHIDVVVPPQYQHPENLEKLATKMPSTVTIHWRLFNIHALMSRAIVSVAGFGLTAYELAYLGVPALLYCQEDEVHDMHRFMRHGTAQSMGEAKHFDGPKLYQTVLDLIANPAARKAMSDQGKNLVDPHAPKNVAQAIMLTTRQGIATTPLY